MKTIIGYNPYLYVMGGGEAYFLRTLETFLGYARVLIEEPSHSSFSRNDTIKLAMLYHGIDLTGIEFVKHGSVSDADAHISMHNSKLIYNENSKYNISLVQVPKYTDVSESHPNLIVFNSEFTKHHWTRINKMRSYQNLVITPPIYATKKEIEKQPGFDIISIGRFGEKLHSKNEHRLLSIFKELKSKLCNSEVRLHIVGISTLLDKKDIIEPCKEDQVFVYQDICRTELDNLLSKADFFWNATGFDINENEFPDKVEHFGMAIVEALVCSTIPIIQPKGGAAEKLVSWVHYIPWEKEKDLITNTLRVLQDQGLRQKLKKNIETTDWFSIFNSVSLFQKQWFSIIDKVTKVKA